MADTPTRPGKWIGAEAQPGDVFDRIDPIWLIAAVAGCLALAWLIAVARRRRDGGCRWVRGDAAGAGAFRRWRCKTCGEEAFSTGRSRPRVCKKDLTAGRL